MTPDQILGALSDADGLPREAMAAAGQCRDAMIPAFLDQIEYLRSADPDTVPEETLSAFLFIFFLLGEWRDARAYRPLAALLRRDPHFLDRLLGDAITEGCARVMAGLCDDDLQPIIAVIEDEAADMFVRAAMLDALVILACDRPATRPAVAAYLEAFFAMDMDKPDILWGTWAFAVADLGLEDLVPMVRQAFAEEWVSPQEADFAFFEEQLRSAVANGTSRRFQISRNSLPIGSAIDELSGWYCFSEAYRKEAATPPSSAGQLSPLFGGSAQRAPKVGRNDPCPCGSGKKYKKCCLQ